MSTDIFTLHSSDPTFHYIRNSNCFFNMQILSSTNHTNTATTESAVCFCMCNADKCFLKESAASTGSLDSQVSLKTASVTLHFSTSWSTCLLFTLCYRSTKPQDPVLPILPLLTWQLSLFHIVITTLKFIWHFSLLPASFNSYTNDVNTYRTIVYHELISTKWTGACSTGNSQKETWIHLKVLESIILTETREPEFIALSFCVVGPGCWDHWLEMMQRDLAKQKAKLGRPELSKRKNWAVPYLCLSPHSHQGFYLLLCLKKGAGPQSSSPVWIHTCCTTFTLQGRGLSIQIHCRINHSKISCS